MSVQEQEQIKELQELLSNERQKGLVAMIKSLEDTTNLRFDNMHKEMKTLIENNHNESTIMLKQIHEQALKTNGRVTKLEETVIPKLEKDILDLQERHIKCPISNGELVEDYEETKEKLKFFKLIGEYPKVTLILLILIIFVLKFLPDNIIWDFLSKLF